QAGEWRLAGDVICRADLFFGDQSKSFADAIWGVVEGGFQRHFAIVEAGGIELNLSPPGTAAEENLPAAFAHHFRSPNPGFRLADCFNHDVSATACRGERSHRLHRVLHCTQMHDVVCSHAAGSFDLRLTFNDRDDVAAHRLGYVNEHQSD